GAGKGGQIRRRDGSAAGGPGASQREVLEVERLRDVVRTVQAAPSIPVTTPPNFQFGGDPGRFWPRIHRSLGEVGSPGFGLRARSLICRPGGGGSDPGLDRRPPPAEDRGAPAGGRTG